MDKFNWKQYILNYPDLQKAGIDTQQKAWKHYNRFGKSEGRNDKFYFNGINNVDIIYFINLEYRKDRYDHILSEFKKINLNSDKIHKIDGILNIEKGSIGCTLSHCKTLEKFIDSGLDNCIIFEDDFTFTSSNTCVNSMFNDFFNSNYFNDFDINLAGSTKTETILEPYLTKIYESKTTSGYIVSKKFAPILLKNFKETKIPLDENWIKLQPISNWYSFKPRIGIQMEGYSDITYKLENYRL